MNAQSMHPRFWQQALNRGLLRTRAGLSVIAKDLGVAGWAGVALMILAVGLLPWANGQKATAEELEAMGALLSERNQPRALPSSAGNPSQTKPSANPRMANEGDAQTAQSANAAFTSVIESLPIRGPSTSPKAADLAAQALRRSVTLSAIESKWQRTTLKGYPVARLDLNMSANGSYPQLRQWINELLVQYPNAQVMESTFERNAASGKLDLQIGLALHFQTPGGRI
jgi:hypothetical protein